MNLESEIQEMLHARARDVPESLPAPGSDRPPEFRRRHHRWMPVVAGAAAAAVVALPVAWQAMRSPDPGAGPSAASSSSTVIPTPATYNPSELRAKGSELLDASRRNEIPEIVSVIAQPDDSGLQVGVSPATLDQHGSDELERIFQEVVDVPIEILKQEPIVPE